MARTEDARPRAEQQLAIRGVDRDLWKEVRKEAVDRGVSVGLVLNEILRQWVAGRKGR